jgi:LPS sulfotransferase NodH/SAM-dependent methyltransferase
MGKEKQFVSLGGSRWIVLCATPRSGSTLVCEDLRNNNLGRPEEHFLPFINQSRDTKVDEMLVALAEGSRDGSGTAAVKVMASYAGLIEGRLRGLTPAVAGEPLFRRLAGLFSNASWVYVSRRSKIRQAISHLLAATRGFNHWVGREGAGWQPGNSVGPLFNMDHPSASVTVEEVAIRCAEILREEEIWEQFFADNSIRPIRIVYEEFVADTDYIKLIGDSVAITLDKVNSDRMLQKLSNIDNETAYRAFIAQGGEQRVAVPKPDANRDLTITQNRAADTTVSSFGVSAEGKLRFVRTIGIPQVYCIVNGRRRHVPHADWWTNEGWPELPPFEIINKKELMQFPLGPPCPQVAELRGKSAIQIVDDPNLMRLYLGCIARGNGIEWGAGSQPLPISLHADVKYVDALTHRSVDMGSIPGGEVFSDFVQVDVVDRIETARAIPDGSLDFVIASHTIEHTPNPVAALVSCHRLLRDSGQLILIIPDRDRTFDRPREITPICHMILDYKDYQRERDLAHYEEWQARVVAGSREAAKDDWEIGADLHYHCFTPASFTELIGASMKYAAWQAVELFFPSAGRLSTSIEFYVVLRK